MARPRRTAVVFTLVALCLRFTSPVAFFLCRCSKTGEVLVLRRRCGISAGACGRLLDRVADDDDDELVEDDEEDRARPAIVSG